LQERGGTNGYDSFSHKPMYHKAISTELARTPILDITLRESIRKYTVRAKAENTKRAYRSDLAHFHRYCAGQNLSALPATPELIAFYLAALADEKFKPATMSRRLAAVSKAHSAAGFESPTSMRFAVVSETWAGIKRTLGTAQIQKAPATVEFLKRMLADAPATLTSLRDHALLLLGFAAALRRSELVALSVKDVAFVPEGVVLTIRSSKTDPDKAGTKVAVASGKAPETCPVRRLRAWMHAGKIERGLLFRSIDRWGHIGVDISDKAVALILKQYAGKAGLDPAVFSGHSLRAGLATSAALAGAGERQIMRHTRHRSEDVVRVYIRDANLFSQNVSSIVGL
jgi:site-specific recombinase XerD